LPVALEAPLRYPRLLRPSLEAPVDP